MNWRSPSLPLLPRHTVQSCISGESIATCVNLTELGNKLSLPHEKTETQSPSRLVHNNSNCNCNYFDLTYFSTLPSFKYFFVQSEDS